MKAVQSKASMLCKSKFVVKEDNPRRVTPSVFSEMLQSTHERMKNTSTVHPPLILERFGMTNTTHRKVSLAHTELPLFQPYPSELVFQNFVPSQTYQLPLYLLNNDKVSQGVNLKHQNSENFVVVRSGDEGCKVAPGMTATFTVFFTPQENKDHDHRLVFVTEREMFEIPVRAIGPRAVLDFPDELVLPACPVKATTEKTQLVRNVGKTRARFKLQTQRPFSVTPSSGMLEVGESLQVTVVFQPRTVGIHQQDLRLHYHTGEDVDISLSGSCEELNIHLEPDSVTLKKTYINMASFHPVSLTNHTEIVLQYRWSAWPSQQEEDWNSSREKSGLPRGAEGQPRPPAIRPLPALPGFLQDPDFLIDPDNCTSIEPTEGEIWPNMTANFHVVFQPEEAKLYQPTLYCDVTGRESRLPLTISAEGLGPNLQLSYEQMDITNVLIGEKVHFEVQISNKGLIDGHFRCPSPETTFGQCFSFNPEEGVVPVGACQTVKVTFASRISGHFCEDLPLAVTGQPQPLTLTLRGCVTGPTFHFNVYDLEFGDVAFGFPVAMTCTLFNTSFVPITFALRVLGDGLGSPSVSFDKYVSDLSQNNWKGCVARGVSARRMEFAVSPAAGSVRAMSDVNIKVTLCSNTVRTYRLAMVMDVEGVGEEIMTLPINARCVVPEITVEPSQLDFQRCYLGLRYEGRVRLTNRGNLPACYGVLDQEHDESWSECFGCPVPRGVIQPDSSAELPLVLVTNTVGRRRHTLRIAVFGSVHEPLEVELLVTGQGPIVDVPSTELHFSKIPVLTDVMRTVQLFNQSPIPAHFTARMSCRKSFWRVEPSEGEVPPRSELELKVVAHLKDTLPFEEKLKISFQDSRSFTVHLSATGTGTTIVSDKPLGPTLDLGTHFSHGSCRFLFTLTNRGQRIQRMFWKFDSSLVSTKKPKRGTFLPPISTPRHRDVVGRGCCVPVPKQKPVFSISPCRVELLPGGSVAMVMTAASDSPQVLNERLVCRGFIGHQDCQETIMSVDVTCTFVAPVISISSERLEFSVKKVKGQSLLPHYEKLLIKNMSSLSLTLDLLLVEPFFLCEAPGDQTSTTTKSLILGVSGRVEVWVGFNPAFYQDCESHIVDECLEIDYREHPQHHKVQLHAEVHYHNLRFSSNVVDFGCVVPCTEFQEVVTISNCSMLPVFYHWTFLSGCKDTDIRNTDVLQKSQKIPEGRVGERRSSSSTLSPHVLLPKSPGPRTNEQSSMSPGPRTNQQSSVPHPGSVEEMQVFDILPISGHLQPEDQQVVTFSLFSYENVSREVVAQCHVDEGPTYEIKLRGEVSGISYSLESNHLDFGVQLFHCVGEIDVTLRNTGKIGFKYSVILPESEEDEEKKADEESGLRIKALQQDLQRDLQQRDNEKPVRSLEVRPGRPRVLPAAGCVKAGAEQCLRVLYLPGVPGVFRKRLQLQVSFLPAEITLTGQGVFPRITLNLPRNLPAECYGGVMQQAREELMNGITDGGRAATESSWTLTNEERLHMEIERLLVKENALTVSSSLLELYHSRVPTSNWHKMSKFKLPEYVLDFGLVIPGRVVSHTVKVMNSGSIPASFHADCRCLTGTGFTVEPEKVKNLPCRETHTFKVTFDPQGAKLELGDKSVVLPIEVSGGPLVQVRLCAVVTVPAVTVSTDTLQFDALQCSTCQIRTIQLLNHELLPCHWSIAEEEKPRRKVKIRLPFDRKKLSPDQQPHPPARVFEMTPRSGVLHPSEGINVHIKFSPTQGCVFIRQLEVRVADSPQRVFITAQGQGDEPQLEFCPAHLELGPCLPLSTNAEAQVSVTNPCSFPIEFYCLELDTQHLEEEKMLRLMPGYDEKKLLLLPPRVPGEGLPEEILEYYNQGSPPTSQELNELDEDEAETHETLVEDMKWKQNNTEIKTKSGKPDEMQLTREGRLDQLEMSPFFRGMSHHMGFGSPPAELPFRNSGGIAIIVYGAPRSGKNGAAAALACYYSAACLSVDAVLADTLQKGTTSPFSSSERHVDLTSTAEYAQRTAVETDQATEDSGCTAALDASDPHSDSVSLNTLDALAKHEEEKNDSGNKTPAHPEGERAHNDLSLEGDGSKVSSPVPEQLLIDILTKRLKLSDCQCGVVIDGLHSAYTEFASSTLQVVLKAVGNRKHIYVLNVSDSYSALKARERGVGEAKEEIQSERVSEYDALPQDEEEDINPGSLETITMQKLRELEQMPKEKKGPRKKSLKGKQCVVDELQSQFSRYEESQVEVIHVLEHWDRGQGSLSSPLPSRENPARLLSVSGATRKKLKDGRSKTSSPLAGQTDLGTDLGTDLRTDLGTGHPASPLDVIPHIVLDVTKTDSLSVPEMVTEGTLPPADDVLGPAIPPPVTFSVVPFPEHRDQADIQQTSFTFLDPSGQGEEDKQEDLEEDKESTASKHRGRAHDKRRKLQKNKRSLTPSVTLSDLELKLKQRLSTFRWVVPAGGELVLKIWFYSESPGTFEQAFNFELVGTRRLYTLTCRGQCSYPSISKHHRTLFAHSSKVQELKEDGLQKCFVIDPGYFEFGQLLCSKTRDRYKEIKYPENTERLVIHNNSGLEAEVQFGFQYDTQATTYLLDPPTMVLTPGQKQELTVWAYPTKAGQMKDSIVCHIKDNPEPVIIRLSCWGVQPELQLDSRHLQFGRVLIDRRNSCSMTMHNKTTLPVSWGLRGVEELGDQFELPQDHGIIPPNTSFVLSMHINAKKPLHIKKVLRLEVSDVEQILGIVQTENIQVTAEAYSINLKIAPDALVSVTDGCLDFGTMRVFGEARQSLKLKNTGKYEVSFKFTFEQTDPALPNLKSIFTASPQSGRLMPGDKSTQVDFVCRADQEILIREQPVLVCQVFDPNIGKGDKIILDIKISVHSVFSSYQITPPCDVSFGPLVYGCKKHQSFTVQNNGVFKMDFNISHAVEPELGSLGYRPARPIGECLKVLQKSSQDTTLQNQLSVGVFTVSPCTGSLPSGAQQLVTVDCAADQLGTRNTGLLIDISGRDPSDQPGGVRYTLRAEVCKPEISLDMASIFEEHHLCHSSSQLSSEQFCNADSIYVLPENKFIFNRVLVGQSAQARFKLTNNSKIPCTLHLAIRCIRTQVRSGNVDVFHLSATTLDIPNQSHEFAAVTFTPKAVQQYSVVFEATIEGLKRTIFQSKVLEFQLSGEGILPSVCVVRPAGRDSRGSPVLQFRRVFVGRRRTLPLVLLNDGPVPAEVQVDLLDEHGVFALRRCNAPGDGHVVSTSSERALVHRAKLRLNRNESVEFEISFSSDKPLTVEANVAVQVMETQYGNTTIPVTAEAYQQLVSLDHISSSAQDHDHYYKSEGNYEVLHFGDCHVDCLYEERFTMTNHSSTQAVRFQWPPSGHHVVFSPQVGHLHAGCSKEVTVAFRSSQPVTLKNQPMRCEVCQVEFQLPVDEVADWDDRRSTGTDPEPICTVVESSQWELDLRVSALCDFVKLSCSSNTISFQDTELFQTRHHQLHLDNVGKVKLEFSWQVFIDSNIVNPDEGERISASGPVSRTGSRRSSALARVTSVRAKKAVLPFTVEPNMGTIDPGATHNFTVGFSPGEVAQFQGRLLCSIPNLPAGDQTPCVVVCGRSLLPHCHFDLEHSDYVSSKPKARGRVKPNTRVLEFKSVGFTVPSTRRFNVMNPTSKVYSFQWRCEDTSGSPFRCLTSSGFILPGSKAEMSFEYLAVQYDTVESSWSFVIETLSLTVPFLCVGTAREPLVYLDRPHIDFGELPIGLKVERTVDLVNRDEVPFHFSVLQSSLLSEDQQSRLILQPMAGTVAPNERLPLSVSFTALKESHVNFRVDVKVKRKAEPLTLTLKASFFPMSLLVQVEKPDGGLIEIVPNNKDTLNFGKVGISEQSTFKFLISNLSRFILEVNFKVTGPKELLQHMKTEPESATVEVGKQLQSSVSFCPLSICNLQNVTLIVKVKNGPVFTFNIKGKSVVPTLDFSFTKFNFGKCFLRSPGTSPQSQTLVIRNKGKRDISIQCLFTNTDYLEVDFQADVLSPGAVMEVPISFYPREPRRYHGNITFSFNSRVTKQVAILGQGIEVKLEDEDPSQKKVKVGTLALGQKMKKQVALLKNTTGSKGKRQNKHATTKQHVLKQRLIIIPARGLTLKASGGSCEVKILFSPGHFLPPFTAELHADSAGLLLPLLTVHGCCQGKKVFWIYFGFWSYVYQKHILATRFIQGALQNNYLCCLWVDSPCFSVRGVDGIPSKTTHSIKVQAPPGGTPDEQWFGRLSVSSQGSGRSSKPCSWVYYLKGYRHD
ncbi:hydrocephalus-inducing protein homolog [Cololabis saira]|uniref:hydrocephalus-inducing protein homolog n=1 Tax=Cololabis saira TaxID=129043 RepID=UPI002AD26656|nr:hydrocephalus-inducing protein homolog [Cololabis saira]